MCIGAARDEVGAAFLEAVREGLSILDDGLGVALEARL